MDARKINSAAERPANAAQPKTNTNVADCLKISLPWSAHKWGMATAMTIRSVNSEQRRSTTTIRVARPIGDALLVHFPRAHRIQAHNRGKSQIDELSDPGVDEGFRKRQLFPERGSYVAPALNGGKPNWEAKAHGQQKKRPIDVTERLRHGGKIDTQQDDDQDRNGDDRFQPKSMPPTETSCDWLMLGNEPVACRGALPCCFVIILFDIDFPNVEVSTEDIPSRINRRQHRMILIVVSMLTVAADQLQIRDAFKVTPYDAEIFFESMVVDRIGLRHANDDAVENVALVDKAERHAFTRRQLHQRAVVGVPQFVPLLHEIFETEGGVRVDPAPSRDSNS